LKRLLPEEARCATGAPPAPARTTCLPSRFQAEIDLRMALLQPRVEARYPPVQVVSVMKSWHDSPAEAMVHPPRRSVRARPPEALAIPAAEDPAEPAALASTPLAGDAGAALAGRALPTEAAKPRRPKSRPGPTRHSASSPINHRGCTFIARLVTATTAHP